MRLAQYIYGTTCTSRMTGEKAIVISAKSIEVCDRLGLTGRVFSTRTGTLAITEGPVEMVQRYVDAVRADALVATMIMHAKRPIAEREFTDFSVWLDINLPFGPHPNVHKMTPQSLSRAMPAAPSARLRVIVDAFFEKGRLVA